MQVTTPILDSFFEKLKQSKSKLLMLDYDGTLAPFIVDREKAIPYPGVLERLQRLLCLDTQEVVLITGRGLDDIKNLVAHFPRLQIWGSHGYEKLSSDGEYYRWPVSKISLEAIEKAEKASRLHLDQNKIEKKPISIAFHWRGLDPEQAKMLEAQIKALWVPFCINSSLEIKAFDGGLELIPKERNKGSVVKDILDTMDSEICMAYLGDDLTDEDAFKVIGQKGLKVLVRKEPRPTLADVRLVPPDELLWFLDEWIAKAPKHKAQVNG